MSEPASQTLPGISRTSTYVAAGRAVGAREPDPSARNPDYLAEKLLGDPSKLDVDHPVVRALSLRYDEAMKDVEVVSSVRMMTIRTRFIDEALARAIAAGATQVVILGAGFDSHAYRCQELLAPGSLGGSNASRGLRSCRRSKSEGLSSFWRRPSQRQDRHHDSTSALTAARR